MAINNKLLKARMMSLLTKPFYLIKGKTPQKAVGTVDSELSEAIVESIEPPKDISSLLDIGTITAKIPGFDVKLVNTYYRQLEAIADGAKANGNILHANQIYEYTVKSVKDPIEGLLGIYYKLSETQRNLGHIDESYSYLNKALKLTLGQYSFNSFQMIECLDNFAEFSKHIHEEKEAHVYNKIIGNILKRLKSSGHGDKYLSYLAKHGYNSIIPGSKRDYNYLKDLFNIYNEVKTIMLNNNLINSDGVYTAKHIVQSSTLDIIELYYYFSKMSFEINSAKREAILNNLDSFLNTHCTKDHVVLQKYLKDRLAFHAQQGVKKKVDEYANKYIDVLYFKYGRGNIYTCIRLLDMYPILLNPDVINGNEFIDNLIDILGEIQDGYFKFFNTTKLTKENLEKLNYKFADLFYETSVLSFHSGDQELGCVSLDSAIFLYEKYLGSSSERFEKCVNLFNSQYKQLKH
jgi:hypothetical protein